MDHKLMRRALARTGEILTASVPEGPPVEVLLVGAAAGILTGEFDPSRTTGDCDALRVEPDALRDHCNRRRE
ncbi:MAG: hypothetical protein WD768_01160 [Phycisphaeraceae bacterium]